MTKSEQKELALKIIRKFRARVDWINNHDEMAFGKVKIGYYDTNSQDDYCMLKYDNIEFTNYSGSGYQIEFKSTQHQETFSLTDWLINLDKITEPEPCATPKEIVIDGIVYRPIAN